MLLDKLAHILELAVGANIDTANGADFVQSLEDVVLGLGTAQEANDGDDALHLDGVEALSEGARTADLDDVLNALAAGGQLAGRLAPVGVLGVVDDVVGAQLLEDLALLLGRSGSDDRRAGSLGKLCFFKSESRVIQIRHLGLLRNVCFHT